MKIQLIIAAATLALAFPAAAQASDVTSATSVSGEPAAGVQNEDTAGQDLRHGLKEAGRGIREAGEDIRALLINGDTGNGDLKPVLIRRSKTAHGMIGAPILNPNGEKIGTLKDIIIDREGDAILAVVSDGGLLGIGSKVAAFDYNRVMAQKPDGTVVMTLSKDMIDHAADFSYDPNDRAKAKVIPTGSISVNELLDGRLVDESGKKAASIENIYFRDDDAIRVIVGFNKTLGLGGDLAALDYDELQVVKKKHNNVDLKMSAAQSVQFEKFRKSATN